MSEGPVSTPSDATLAGAQREFETLDLGAWCNADAEQLDVDTAAGPQELRGIPFLVGAEGAAGARLVVAGGEAHAEPLEIPIARQLRHVVFAHQLLDSEIANGGPHGVQCATYVFTYEDDTSVRVPVRERFEINAVPAPWGLVAFSAWADEKEFLYPRFSGRYADFSLARSEVELPDPRAFCLWAWENPRPEEPVRSVTVEPTAARVCIGAITLGHLDEPVFNRAARETITIDFGEGEGPADLLELEVRVDRGAASHVHRLPPGSTETFLSAPLPGWGEPRYDRSRSLYAHIAASRSATVALVHDGEALGSLRWGELLDGRELALEGGIRVRLLEGGRNWVETTVVDDETGRPIPCRIHFRNPDGVPFQPYGHHEHLGLGRAQMYDVELCELDRTADLLFGGAVYAYIDGRCEGWLPQGEVLVDVARGFEYEPLRTRVTIEPGQRTLELRLRRRCDMRARRFMGGDTHVHFLSTRLAHVHAAGEGLDVLNLLLAHSAHEFSGTGEFTGAADVCAELGTVVNVGQENMIQALGHIALLGIPRRILPTSTGGPYESGLGDALETTLSRWADECHALGGTVIGCHMTSPNAELAVLAATGRLDALEWLGFGRYSHQDYYRYLEAGFRVPLVAGTDGLGCEHPVGITRTYVRIPEPLPFTYESWCAGLREGGTFVTNGPLLDVRVDGCGPGETVELPAGGGTVEIEATAESIFPIESLEIVTNGEVTARSVAVDRDGRLHLRAEVEVRDHSWIAARCGGRDYLDGLRHNLPGRAPICAHSSPTYVSVGGPWRRADPCALEHLAALVQGGLEYVRNRAPQWPEGAVTHRHGGARHVEYLEEPFHEAAAVLQARRADAAAD